MCCGQTKHQNVNKNRIWLFVSLLFFLVKIPVVFELHFNFIRVDCVRFFVCWRQFFVVCSTGSIRWINILRCFFFFGSECVASCVCFLFYLLRKEEEINGKRATDACQNLSMKETCYGSQSMMNCMKKKNANRNVCSIVIRRRFSTVTTTTAMTFGSNLSKC